MGSVIVVLGIALLSVSAFAEDQGGLKEKKDRIGYALGADIGQKMKDLSFEINADLVAEAIKDVMSGKPAKLNPDEVRTVLVELTKEAQAKHAELMKIQGAKNKTEGEAYLAANGKKAGVISLPSGLQYTVLKEGTGKTPKTGDTVVVNYKGTLINGTEFDSSVKRKQPGEFKVGSVIAGWNEALTKMKEGSKWLLVIPAKLAYGEKNMGPIGPNSVLIFEVELIKIKDKS